MGNAALDHLNDIEYDEAYDYINGQFIDTLTRVLDEWIERGWINESDKKRALKDWDNNRVGLLPSLMG